MLALMLLIFAILGLWAMYFLLADITERFYLLNYGLATIVMFVGVKMLITVFAILSVSIVASLLHPLGDTRMGSDA